MARRRGYFTKVLFLIVFVAVAVAVVSMVPLSPLKHSVEARLSGTLGRNVTIDSVRINLLGRPHLILTGVTAREDPAFGDGVFLRANEVRAGFDTLQLMKSRQIAFDSIIFKSAHVDLVKNRDGVWSWTTLGKQRSQLSKASSQAYEVVSLLLSGGTSLSPSTLRHIRFENASVRLKDNSGPEPSEVFYKNLVLSASLTPQRSGDSGRSSQATGSLVLQSEEDGEADRFKATLPFDIKIDDRGDSLLSVSGSIGPGPIETKNISIGAFAINGEINSNQNAPMTGNGHMSARDLDIHTANLSDRVARALNVDQIGDMSPGTTVAGLETEFQIREGTVHTTELSILQLDGLGDATAPVGSFRIESALIVNYATTVVLSPDATSRVKSVSPALGIVVTILESNNRVSVPINVTGDVRNPEVQVDVSRIF